jgi:hypothetical protein
VRRAQAGDATALPALRAALDKHPEVWQHVGDLAALVERAWTALLAADHPLVAESVRRSVAALKAELAGAHAPRLERLLVDQVAACWLEVTYLEGVSAGSGTGSLDQAGFRLKRLESAQKRYLNAVKTLTTLRALVPAGLAPAQPLKLHEGPAEQRA